LPSDTNLLWQKGFLFNLNYSQSSLTNWSAGGDKFSMSINSILNLYAKYARGKNSWDNTFDFNLGYVNSTNLGARKNDDRFELVSKYGRFINPKTNFALLVSMPDNGTNIRNAYDAYSNPVFYLINNKNQVVLRKFGSTSIKRYFAELKVKK
jgi:hypothetical protein